MRLPDRSVLKLRKTGTRRASLPPLLAHTRVNICNESLVAPSLASAPPDRVIFVSYSILLLLPRLSIPLSVGGEKKKKKKL